MNLRRALFIAACVLPWAAAPAAAQFQPPRQEPPCMKDFAKLRNEAERLAGAVMAGQKRKVPLSEACKLLTAFAVAQDKMLKFAKANQAWCGIPPQIVQQISLGHSNAVKARTNVCRAAAAPPRPTGPTLSDALGGSIPDPSNIKTGRGTFDTLTGTPLGK
jgi:hypothetical protein